MKKLLIILLSLSAIILSAYYFIPRSAPNGAGNQGSEASIPEYQYTQTYSNEEYRFSFKYPEGFTVATIPSIGEGEGGGETILVESSDKKVGIQILISSYGFDVDITEAMVRSDIPEMKIENVQEVEIGSGRKGVAFISDNQAFNGQSREVWFVFNSNLYQISTYAKYDEFLKKIFATWTFTGASSAI